jgi:large subunit ribosomal protein L23
VARAASRQEGSSEPDRQPRDILLRPVISEKSYRLPTTASTPFIVAPGANKTQIRQAVQACSTSR